jgi:hypothetical protein
MTVYDLYRAIQVDKTMDDEVEICIRSRRYPDLIDRILVLRNLEPVLDSENVEITDWAMTTQIKEIKEISDSRIDIWLT